MAAGLAYACAPGTLPNFLAGGTCGTSFATSQAANDFALAGWTIWLTSYFDDGQDLFVTKPLTIQGSPLGSAYLGQPGGTIGIYVQASNVTIRDAYTRGDIESVSQGGTLRLQDIFATTAPGGYALYVGSHSGSVIVSQYFGYGSTYGAYINTLVGTGTVTVVNSSFEYTTSDNGLEIHARNAVKLENVNVSNNHFDGAFIEYAKGLSIKNSFFNNNSDGVVNGNYGFGLKAIDVGTSYGYTRGPVLLQNVYASYNNEDGIYLGNTGALTLQNASLNYNQTHGMYVDGYSSGTLDGVIARYNGLAYGEGVHLWLTSATTVTNSTFEYNDYDGLYVLTAGAVTLKGVKAYYNYNDGVDIDTIGTVSVQGGYYSTNYYGGLVVDTRGSITLNGVVATQNNWSNGGSAAAIDLDNCQWTGSACGGTGGVTITNTMGQNVIANNYYVGLYILSRGTVSINTLNVRDNWHSGIYIDNCRYGGSYCMGVGSVSLTNVNLSENGIDWSTGGTHASSYGLYVYSGGSVTLDKVTSERNTSYGIYLENDNSSTAKTITLKNIYAISNYAYGVTAYARGAVSVNHINSFGNYGTGLVIGSNSSVTISNTLGANIVENNYLGVDIDTSGTVSITGLSASDNYVYQGLTVDASWGLGSVTITNSRFNNNDDYGLAVYSQGNISLTNVQANGNLTMLGAYLDNVYVAGKSVTVNKGSFSSNGTYGLYIDASGNVTLNGINASDNHSNGLYVRNDYFTTAAYNVTISSSLGVNMFNNNSIATVTYDNVYIRTAGNVTISKATANSHFIGNAGFYIYHTGNWSGKKVTFTCSTADYNWNFGYAVQNVGGFPVGVYLNGSGATGNWINYPSWGAVSWFFTRTNCP